MSSKERRQREKEEIRTKIMDAARELFLEEGYEAVTMRKIAEKIDYTPTAIYFHYEDKEALFRELCDTDFRALQETLQNLARHADPFERLRKMGHAYVSFALDHPNHYRLMFMTAPPFKDVDKSTIERGNPEVDAYAFLRATVAEAMQAGRLREELKDVDLVAQVVWSGVHGVLALYLTHGDHPWFDWRPVKKIAQTMLDTILAGMVHGELAEQGQTSQASFAASNTGPSMQTRR
jgi:AcrR family transcriptional regulator